ncbi:hypothetical protein KM043_017854 [Ampulex compressa]|nr:hypothetical protein KM043_017854 [Ampulex compressa]
MSLMKKAIGGSIHRIREFELEKVNLIDEFDILQIVGEGWFGKILLTEHRSTQTEMVLKALPKAYTGISDFFREFHYGLHLAAHRNIITTYDVAFETAGFYVFSQEYAPLGDLTSNVTETGLGELHAKRVARQLAAAVHHIHTRELVHRDIKLDNVLIFRSDFSRIKLCDFGETRRVNTVVRRHNEWLPYSPPEVLQIDTDETYKALTSHDVWQFGIVLFVCLTGCLPWQKAALDDPRYTRYQNWHNATLNIAKKPKLFQLISSRAQRMFKRLLDPKPEKRPVTVLEVNKYLEDRWLAKLGAEKALNGGADERDELCPSMYSFHSSLEEKNQLLHTLTTYGIETTVDRSKKKDRIRQWIESSAIAEKGEEDESDINEDVHFYADEDEEPSSMKGRHFPERRPSAKPVESRKKNGTKASTARKRQPVKPVERKIPFAPQVAEERETIARFASFPNGDPSLAIVTNGTNGTVNVTNSAPMSGALATKADSSSKDARSSFVRANGQALVNSPVNDLNAPQDDTMLTTGGFVVVNSTSAEDAPQTGEDLHRESVSREDNARNLPKSPQIPTRKHRSQTAPFPAPTSSLLNGSRVQSTKRSQSATVLPTAQPEKSVTPVARPEESFTVPFRPDNPSAANIQSGRPESYPTAAAASLENRSSTATRAERSVQLTSQMENPTLPMLPAPRAENQSSNDLSTSRNEKSMPGSGIPTNSLSMSVASHLVMQSFSALQGINAVPTANASSPMSSPVATRTSTPTRTTTPPSMKTNSRFEETIKYGKDAYEHYGIAQGVILRTEVGRQGSSGSRSVSN